MKRQNISREFFQQGDVILIPEDLPKNRNEIKSPVVQEGEHTGHAHRLTGGEYEQFEHKNVRYLRIVKPTTLKHEEHHPIEIPLGTYRIGIVKQFDYESHETRNVID